MSKTRLLVSCNQLVDGKIIKIINGDFNYLIRVMRCKINDGILIFNGLDGEWLANIISINKKDCALEVTKKIREQYFPPKITLAFAPVKNVRIDFIASKATELGVTNFQPILTKHSVVSKINLERFNANVKEAAEQCERLDIPVVHNIIPLEVFIKNLPNAAVLILADESGNGKRASDVLSRINGEENSEIIVFIGPEGGFSKEEFDLFYSIQDLHSINLGPRILRADTAMISAITLVQEFLGDFNRTCSSPNRNVSHCNQCTIVLDGQS